MQDKQDAWPPPPAPQQPGEEGLWWPPDDLGRQTLGATLGLLAGAITVLLLNLTLGYLAGFLPLRDPWPARYYARFDYGELAVSALAAAAIVKAAWRRFRVFAVGFGLAALAAVAFGVFLTAMGFDGSWYIP